MQPLDYMLKVRLTEADRSKLEELRGAKSISRWVRDLIRRLHRFEAKAGRPCPVCDGDAAALEAHASTSRTTTV